MKTALLAYEPDRACVVLDQPQLVGNSRVLRLVFNTAALHLRASKLGGV